MAHAAMDKQQCLQATSTPAITTGMNVATGGVVQDDGLNIKEEWADADLDIGPTVLQHMDATYRPAQPDVSIIKQESRIEDNDMNAILCGGVKEEIIEDERRADTDAQRSNEAAQSVLRARSPLHSCEECMITYARIRSLLAHYRYVHSTESQKCTKCNRKFPKAYLYQHTTDAHSEQQHECAVCKKTYRSKQSLTRHVNNFHRATPAVKSPVVYTCDYCLKTYTTKQVLLQHIDVVHTNVRYRCSECNKEYKGKCLLQRHIRRAHSKEEHEANMDDHRGNKAAQSEQRARFQPVSCDKCGKTYASKYALMAHNESLHSTESHKCTKCDRNFPSKAYLNRHTIDAHSEQLYKCTVCKKICRSKAALNTHVYRIHRTRPAADTDDQRSNEAAQSELRARPQLYSCDKCMKTYASKYTLLAHIENLHSTESQKCTKCNKKFPSKAYLYRHTSTAHREQQYECAVCKKTYRSKMALYNHVYYAHQPRPAESRQLHTCTNCGKDFNSKLRCRQHKKRGKCTRSTASSTSAAASTSLTASDTSAVASTSRQQHNVVIVKEEPAEGELELGPTVFQHMDCNYRPYKLEPQLE